MCIQLVVVGLARAHLEGGSRTCHAGIHRANAEVFVTNSVFVAMDYLHEALPAYGPRGVVSSQAVNDITGRCAQLPWADV